jgi:ADP-ribosyl-[dinitrogen reductase] hydrolase
MVGGGPFKLRPGEWTDDTSMALCLAVSLLEKNHFDPRDQMERYSRWAADGYMSSNGRCFDIGTTVSAALRAFARSGEPYSGSSDPHSAGNGCLMRLAPVPMFAFPSEKLAIELSGESSRTTHQASECIEASQLFGAMILRALNGASKNDVLFAQETFRECAPPLSPRLSDIANGEYRNRSEGEIRGSGYVVASLEAALWSFYTTDSFSDAILRAANLGDDADTTAAICGQVAGAFYGVSAIPESWRKKLVQEEFILDLSDRLFARATTADAGDCSRLD